MSYHEEAAINVRAGQQILRRWRSAPVHQPRLSARGAESAILFGAMAVETGQWRTPGGRAVGASHQTLMPGGGVR